MPASLGGWKKEPPLVLCSMGKEGEGGSILLDDGGDLINLGCGITTTCFFTAVIVALRVITTTHIRCGNGIREFYVTAFFTIPLDYLRYYSLSSLPYNVIWIQPAKAYNKYYVKYIVSTPHTSIPN